MDVSENIRVEKRLLKMFLT